MVNKIITIIVAAILIMGGTFLVTRATMDKSEANDNTEIFSLINPVVTSSLQKHFIVNFQPLRKALVSIQNKYPQKTYAYFAYLNNAAWLGVNERELITAASLIKVPLAMAVYKAIEEGKLDPNLEYGLEEIDLDPSFGELYKIKEDQTLTVEKLIEIMLTKSDNTAANALYKIFIRVGIADPLNDVYRSMGWEITDSHVAPNYGVIHVKVLSNMFLSLYNSTYVDPEHSQRILEHLTKTNFNEQIVAGVPSGVSVAHKIGIHELNKTYSDCGIVYAPNRNYILCVASEGASQDRAGQYMAEVSKVVYEYVINN